MSMLPRDAHRRLELRAPLSAGFRDAQLRTLYPIIVKTGDTIDTTWHADGSVTMRVKRPAPLPPIDYSELVRVAYEEHGYAQGTRYCIAFARGAEWMREVMVKAQEEAQ